MRLCNHGSTKLLLSEVRSIVIRMDTAGLKGEVKTEYANPLLNVPDQDYSNSIKMQIC